MWATDEKGGFVKCVFTIKAEKHFSRLLLQKVFQLFCIKLYVELRQMRHCAMMFFLERNIQLNVIITDIIPPLQRLHQRPTTSLWGNTAYSFIVWIYHVQQQGSSQKRFNLFIIEYTMLIEKKSCDNCIFSLYFFTFIRGCNYKLTVFLIQT